MARTARSDANWIAIEAEFRAGIKSIREIAESHGISDTAIRKRAKAEGWEQNLRQRINMAVEEKLARTAAAEGEDVIEANANALASVELTQRSDIRNLRELVSLLTVECQAQCRDIEVFRRLGELMASPDEDGNPDKLNELYRKVVSMPGRIQAVKQLAETLKILIELERKVLKMDAGDGSGAGGVEEFLRAIGRA